MGWQAKEVAHAIMMTMVMMMVIMLFLCVVATTLVDTTARLLKLLSAMGASVAMSTCVLGCAYILFQNTCVYVSVCVCHCLCVLVWVLLHSKVWDVVVLVIELVLMQMLMLAPLVFLFSSAQCPLFCPFVPCLAALLSHGLPASPCLLPPCQLVHFLPPSPSLHVWCCHTGTCAMTRSHRHRHTIQAQT